jgi:AbiV family abortive infection protein
LALEEAGKFQIVLALLLGLGSREELWRAYRRHTEKTAFHNFAIEMRAGVHFPELNQEVLRRIRDAGPSPQDLDATKQLALYSDCFATTDDVAVHLPRNLDWKDRCEHVVMEATALVSYLRDYPPQELEVWVKHSPFARERSGSLADRLKPLHEELVQKGFVTSAQWAPILTYLENMRPDNKEFQKP